MNYSQAEILHSGSKAIILHLNTFKSSNLTKMLGRYPKRYTFIKRAVFLDSSSDDYHHDVVCATNTYW
jgi:hypothetical protein